jgi:hypothetical protein
MRTNVAVKTPAPRTHEGAVAARINPVEQLRRSVMANMLWEDEFYEEGQSIAKRIQETVAEILKQKNGPQTVADIAYEARTQMKLRHVPLLLVAALIHANTKEIRALVAGTIARVIQRPDEMGELISLYWNANKQNDGSSVIQSRKMLPSQVKKGLGEAFRKFDAYALGKYNSDAAAVKLRDVLFLAHVKPLTEEQVVLWKKLTEKTLESPDTWEVALSGGADKKETFTRLLNEEKLGALALLRNLRNMQQAGVDESLIREGLGKMKTERVLPFRFISAAKYAPQLEPQLEETMFRCLAAQEKLSGKSILIVDCSGSMHGPISGKSELDRLSAAAALAMLLREVCEEVAVYATAGDDLRRTHATILIPPRRGFGLRDLLSYERTSGKIGGGGIFLKEVIEYVRKEEKGKADRIIVITDEQDCDLVNKPASAKPFGKNNYLINVASFKNGIGYGDWVHIDGWSEAIVDYIERFEQLDTAGEAA